MKNKTNGFSIAGFVLSIIGNGFMGLLFSFIGLAVAKKENSSKVLSIIGVIVSIIKIILVVIGSILIILFCVMNDIKTNGLYSHEESYYIPVMVNYDDTLYSISEVPETVKVTLKGSKSEVYLARQTCLNAILDVYDYEASSKKYHVKYTLGDACNNIKYRFDPSFVNIKITENKYKIISNVKIKVDGLRSTLTASAVSLDDQVVDVKVSGDANKLSTITEDDIAAYIDLTGYEPGQYEVEILTKCNSSIKCTANKTINIIIKER